MKAVESPLQAIAAALVRARELVAAAKARRPLLVTKRPRRKTLGVHV